MAESDPQGITPDEIATQEFAVVRKGFDTNAVRVVLVRVANELREAHRREAELERRLRSVPEHAGHPELDEESLVAGLGAEASHILQAARDAGRDITARAEAAAAALIERAEGIVAERTEHADSDAALVRDQARTDALAIESATREECRRMVDEAREARKRILSDLVERRRALHLQLEQLRAAKDALAAIIETISHSMVASVEEVRTRLAGSEEAARLAAASAVIDPEVEAELELEVAELSELERITLAEIEPARPSEVTARAGFELAERNDLPLAVATASVADSATADGLVVAAEGVVARSGSGPDGGGPTLEDVPDPEDAPDPSVLGAISEIDALFDRIRQARSDALGTTAPGAEEPERSDAPGTHLDSARFDSVGSSAGADGDPFDTVAIDEAPIGALSGDALPASAHDTAVESATFGTERLEDDGATRHAGRPGDDRTLLLRRDELLAPAIAELARSLKRAMRVEENELRDSARHLPRDPDALLALVQPSTLGRIVDASERALALARHAGEVFVGEQLGLDALIGTPEDPALAAERLAREIVEPLRARIESVLKESGNDMDPSAAVGVAFRDWRGSRIESVAEEFAVWAFSAGSVAATRESGRMVAWVVDDGETSCPDCEDNALISGIVPGDAFPTGHVLPPSHPGCRCVLVPVSGR